MLYIFYKVIYFWSGEKLTHVILLKFFSGKRL